MEKSEIKSFHNIIYNIDTAAHWTDRNFLGATLLLPDMLQTNWATNTLSDGSLFLSFYK